MSTDNIVQQNQFLLNWYKSLANQPRPKDKYIIPLHRIKHLLRLLENPQNNYPTIHITGTSGKGSTSTMIASILHEHGYKVGLFTSPALQIINEKYQLNTRIISTSTLLTAYHVINEVVEIVAKLNPFGRPNRFETEVATAFWLFSEEKVDLAIIEVGVGGQTDQTNVIDSHVSVITNIGLDHTRYLGETISEIAINKAGIIKQEQIVISGIKNNIAKNIIQQKCQVLDSSLWEVNTNFSYQKINETQFSVTVKDKTYTNLSLRLSGEFQMDNAACAIAACYAFDSSLKNENVVKGLFESKINGRFEIMQHNPLIILDGAHNKDKMGALIKSINQLYAKNKKVVILAIKDGKNHVDIINELVQLKNISSIVLMTFQSHSPSSVSVSLDILLSVIKQINPRVEVYSSTSQKQALEIANKLVCEKDLILVTGSLYLVGNIRNHWHNPSDIIIETEISGW